jgi:signal transduction histidine kinase
LAHSASTKAVSHQSFQFPRHSMTLTGRAWPREDSVVVFITSTRGTTDGAFVLSALHGRMPDAEGMVGVELLAANIAMSMENAIAKKRTFQSEKLEGMGQLVAGVAHELNNPLTAVLGYTEILTEKTNDASTKYDLNVMRREALRMKRIIESLQQFSRKQRVERENVNLLAVIEDTVASRADEIREMKIEIVKQLDPALPSIVANQSLIDQIFQHIFANAMDAVAKAGLKRILIEARALGDQVHIQVSDSGAGFKDVGRVFDPFYTTKGPGKGTGLGLSLCYGIIRDHGGEITASNLHPLGACISIQLPLVSLEARSQTPQAAAPVIR